MMLMFLIPLFGLIVVFFNFKGLLKKPEGTEYMREISLRIREGADAFINHEYKKVAIYAVVIAMILGILTAWYVSIAFLIGALMSSLAGYLGMKAATRANVRVAEAARQHKKIGPALKTAFQGGSIMGLSVGSLALLGFIVVMTIFRHQLEPEQLVIVRNYLGINFIPITMTLSGYALGCSIIAMFDRVGGGVYTKAADMAADLVGKTELRLPEDDPRNPATIADNVGDNVGDVAGLGADLLESYVGSILSVIVLASYIFVLTSTEHTELVIKLISYPIGFALIGLLSCIAGVMFVIFKKSSNKPHAELNFALFLSALLTIVGNFFYTKFSLSGENNLESFGFRYGPFSAYFSAIIGIAAGIIIGLLAEYYTSDDFSPTRKLSHKSMQGTGMVISGGLALGMMSTFLPCLMLFAAILAADHFAGLYGVAMAAVGMLSFVAMSVTVDSYGPIADNAGGISEMSGLEPEVRQITDRLDMVGNTTAAIGKGFAIGSAALAALSLFASYMFSQASPGEYVKSISELLNLNIINARTLGGAVLGAALPYLFSGILIEAVVKAASKMVDEIRRQVKERPGIIDGTEKPDYQRCISISADGALQQMALPAMIAIVTPVLSGFLLGVEFVGGLLVGTTLSGIMLALFTANAGGAWDNAKKYLEQGNIEGLNKGSQEHSALVVGDTVGDPLKDTVGPSLDILIKIMAVISLIFAPLFQKFSIF
ncbi:MAG: K(+)-stimulated pyrophosphate-energized sodium pump [Pseudothermotoga sp.]|jgi:K(+)-stimulated pyrophosphate-energized sodium pump|uniref:sodium-translocating pyrophosphatase n=1 Tax=Pseudothermotoga TaxID=1643951 RepID=UPI00074A0823|nr:MULTISPECIES: sodium-translocating pyrophosphatase [Pseudothermotoga]KUK20680.1 MAG: Putative K(+)-stimulated pyrophosphate-energized sodium pump [Pseudothermotoga lettingae]MDI3494138.1 K(+)-stimulated pyrophosphate-energized sodium pump [Pseudothermotoga sp.]HBJ81978.1 sodium-translocating pyrophosphatase [Pseudothermotoga sp.]HBT26720.1 sodium-translocating pyrophosphatase [Pseudothermotoga sp.]